MAGFVLYLLDHFGLRCRMVELRSKAPIINLPTGNVEGDSAMNRKEALSIQRKPTPKPFNHKEHEGHKGGQRLIADER